LGIERWGLLNGGLARAQQLARAGGPIAASAAASYSSYSVVFLTMAAALTAASAAWTASLRGRP
jgi:hypothetical protein